MYIGSGSASVAFGLSTKSSPTMVTWTSQEHITVPLSVTPYSKLDSFRGIDCVSRITEDKNNEDPTFRCGYEAEEGNMDALFGM